MRKKRVGNRDFESATKAARFLLKKHYPSDLSQTNIAKMLEVSIPLVNDEAKKMGLVGIR